MYGAHARRQFSISFGVFNLDFFLMQCAAHSTWPFSASCTVPALPYGLINDECVRTWYGDPNPAWAYGAQVLRQSGSFTGDLFFLLQS